MSKAVAIKMEKGFINCICGKKMYLKQCDENRSLLELQVKEKDKWINELLAEVERLAGKAAGELI